MRGRSGSLVQVVHRQPLTRTSSVSVVTVGSRVLVLGTTEQQITVLTELDPDELAADLVLVPGGDDEDGEPTQIPVLMPAPSSLPSSVPSSVPALPTTTVVPCRRPSRRRTPGRCPACCPARRRPPCRHPDPRRHGAGPRRQGPHRQPDRLGPVARHLASGARRRHGQGVMTGSSRRVARLLGIALAAVVLWLALPAGAAEAAPVSQPSARRIRPGRPDGPQDARDRPRRRPSRSPARGRPRATATSPST